MNKDTTVKTINAPVTLKLFSKFVRLVLAYTKTGV